MSFFNTLGFQSLARHLSLATLAMFLISCGGGGSSGGGSSGGGGGGGDTLPFVSGKAYTVSIVGENDFIIHFLNPTHYTINVQNALQETGTYSYAINGNAGVATLSNNEAVLTFTSVTASSLTLKRGSQPALSGTFTDTTTPLTRAEEIAAADIVAYAVLNEINPQSVSEDCEYGGFIYRTVAGEYLSTSPQKGTMNMIQIMADYPRSSVPVASYHTHAGPPKAGYQVEDFSPTDLRTDIAEMINGYLGTPLGQFKRHDYLISDLTRAVTTLSPPAIANNTIDFNPADSCGANSREIHR